MINNARENFNAGDEKYAGEMFEKVVAMEGDLEWEAKTMIEKISNK